jgi:hypothetical protein
MNKLLFFCLSVTECPLILLLLDDEDSNAHGRVDAKEALLEPPMRRHRGYATPPPPG